MKISKLFHWLYAFVMLLPIFAIGSTILVNSFNEKVKGFAEQAEIQYKYQSNEVNSIADLVTGRIYNYTLNRSDLITGSYHTIFNCTELTINNTRYTAEYSIDNTQVNYLSLRANDVGNVYLYSQGVSDFFLGANSVFPETQVCTFVYYPFQDIDVSKVSICTDIEILGVIITEQAIDNISDIFYYAVDKVTESPIFSWAYNSFLVAPFSYIVSLFSMPTNSPIVMLLSYWLAVSIIWLVFDLVMYVPQLVHRWLDKGVLE